ncbi:MAG: phenylalanine--tRNA ligase subunit alpha [Salibacteraceae bacterium]
MQDKIERLREEIDAFKADSKDQVESFRIKYLGSKGALKGLFSDFKSVPNELRREFGQKLNELQNRAKTRLEELRDSVEDQDSETQEAPDLTRPAKPTPLGSRHPVSIVRNEIVSIFSGIGFSVEEGPEIEDDWHNFTALNFPPEHPARDMQDTFFIEKGDNDIALRTHTSSVQVRALERAQPPVRIVMPGRVFRNEDISARSHCIFHQIEGLYIDRGVSFADMKQTLLHFVREFFTEKAEIRLRPSYFPFTEPSAEVDVYWGLETETDYRITKGTGWLEIMGCGMVDPNVLENCNIDSKEYSGFAFGMGVERIAMLRYGIPDIRLLFENDQRFLEQFKTAY